MFLLSFFFRKMPQRPRRWRRKRLLRRGRPQREMPLPPKNPKALQPRRRKPLDLLYQRSRFLLRQRKFILLPRQHSPSLPNNWTQLHFWTGLERPRNHLLSRTLLWTSQLSLGRGTFLILLPPYFHTWHILLIFVIVLTYLHPSFFSSLLAA